MNPELKITTGILFVHENLIVKHILITLGKDDCISLPWRGFEEIVKDLVCRTMEDFKSWYYMQIYSLTDI